MALFTSAAPMEKIEATGCSRLTNILCSSIQSPCIPSITIYNR